METLRIILLLVTGLGILNVWLLRFNKNTAYRGGSAGNMKEEFRAYGLPVKLVYLVGFIKCTLAILLLAGIWFEELVMPAAIGMGIMMLGAIIMHINIGDNLKQSMPALSLLVICGILAWI
ncbi:DoxX family protein [Gramella sp. BOM4]|nr:DoxX family protein [Christiangramia bathymodioli]